MENVFDYEDIQLIPAKSIVKSRSECDTSVIFGEHRFKLPVVPANMQTIIDENIATLLAKRLGFVFRDGDEFHPAANVEKRLWFARDHLAMAHALGWGGAGRTVSGISRNS